MPATEVRGRWALPLSMFIGTLAWSFVYVSLPFYIERISTVDAAATLRWTGWILGISSLVTVLIAPFSAHIFGERNPKGSYIATQMLQGGGFFLMGAVSTFAFIMVGRSGGDVRRGISAIQSGMTMGQVLGPAAGALVAARVGFRVSFVVAGFMLWACSALVAWGVPSQRAPVSGHDRTHTASLREVATVCLLVLGGSTQVFFLTAILPKILPPLGVPETMTLEVGGLLIFATGLAAALGAIAAPRIGELIGDRTTIVWFLVASSLGLAALALAPGVWSFGILRFVQVLCIAPVFPLSVAAIAQRASGTAIGVVNSSRIAAAFVGPVLATTLLAWVSPAVVYLTLAGLGLLVVPLVAGLGAGSRARKEGVA